MININFVEDEELMKGSLRRKELERRKRERLGGGGGEFYNSPLIGHHPQETLQPAGQSGLTGMTSSVGQLVTLKHC